MVLPDAWYKYVISARQAQLLSMKYRMERVAKRVTASSHPQLKAVAS